MKEKIKIAVQDTPQSPNDKQTPDNNPFSNKPGEGTKKMIATLDLVCHLIA
jgi:hypothetical protein